MRAVKASFGYSKLLEAHRFFNDLRFEDDDDGRGAKDDLLSSRGLQTSDSFTALPRGASRAIPQLRKQPEYACTASGFVYFAISAY